MKLDDALTEAVNGARMTAPHMQTGCYIEHSFTRGFLRCWPVDRIEDEPNRTQCEFRANDDDRAADWIEVERPSLAVDHSPRDAWGKTTPATTWGEVFADKTPVSGGWRTPDVAAVDPVPARDVWGVPKV